MRKINWYSNPFPYAIIDNFLSEDFFESLKIELNQDINEIQEHFQTPLESKTIYKSNARKNCSKKIIEIMGSNEIKEMISEKVGEFEIFSLGDFTSFAGYSPYHVTNNDGYLGSHIDHSSIRNGEYRHIANTIFFASSEWGRNFGGETILFSSNGFKIKEIIEPIPNRLLVFIHTANSFHGVKPYSSSNNVERRTFYHDYYVHESNVDQFMTNINFNRKNQLTHSFHGTTFIPFVPFGLKLIKAKTLLNSKNLKYIPTYFIYLFNVIFKTRITSFRDFSKSLVLKIRNFF